MTSFFQTWKGWARALKREVHALYLACRDPRTPWYAKFVAGLVAAYALRPIDLIPDPIPLSATGGSGLGLAFVVDDLLSAGVVAKATMRQMVPTMNNLINFTFRAAVTRIMDGPIYRTIRMA